MDAPLLAGIIPLKSPRMAAWMNENVPGIEVESGRHDVVRRALDDAATGVRVNARGSKRKIVSVQWDGSQQSCDHEQMRLCAIAELAEATQSVFNGHAE